MNILFLHTNFPAQFSHLAQILASSDQNEVVFLSQYQRKDMYLPKVRHIRLPASPAPSTKNKAKEALLKNFHTGEIFANAMLRLQEEGFYPDIVYDHPGWGCGMYVPDIYPDAARICYCEWFYTKGADFAFFAPKKKRSAVAFATGRQNNLCQLDALRECDLAISPTHWQMSQYPGEFHNKFQVIHDGIDATFFSPASEKNADTFSFGNVSLPKGTPIVSYTGRGLEPYRGFPQFYNTLPKVLKRNPQCHILIMGEDRTCYSRARSDGKTWGQYMRETVAVDETRVHFLPFSSYETYRRLLQASTVHIYFTVPFVLSWSMLEAMSCGCLLIASDTEPVREVIQDQKNGLLTPFWDEQALAEKIIHCLEYPEQYASMRIAARETVLKHYNLKQLLPKQLEILETVLKRKQTAPLFPRKALP